MNLAIFFTLLNLICGLLAIIGGIFYPQHIPLLSMLLLIALLCDMIDGRIARKLNQTSSLWAYLDSLADSLSFAVAPALMLLLTLQTSIGTSTSILITNIIFSCIFVCSGAWRLARFHTLIEENPTQKVPYYIGMPITINGILFPVLLIFNAYFSLTYFPMIWIGLLVLSSYLMISTHKFPKW